MILTSFFFLDGKLFPSFKLSTLKQWAKKKNIVIFSCILEIIHLKMDYLGLLGFPAPNHLHTARFLCLTVNYAFWLTDESACTHGYLFSTHWNLFPKNWFAFSHSLRRPPSCSPSLSFSSHHSLSLSHTTKQMCLTAALYPYENEAGQEEKAVQLSRMLSLFNMISFLRS